MKKKEKEKKDRLEERRRETGKIDEGIEEDKETEGREQEAEATMKE